MTKEQETLIGEQIRKLAMTICSALESPWYDIVFTVAYRNGKAISHLSDMFYFREEPDDDYTNAYSKEGLNQIKLPVLRKIAKEYRKLSEVCEENGSRWCQYTICIDSKGHFESFFEYPSKLCTKDPFDRANLERWEKRFLYSE